MDIDLDLTGPKLHICILGNMKKLFAILMFFSLAIYFTRRENPDLFENVPKFFSPTQSESHAAQITEIQKHRKRIAELETQLSQTTAIANKLYSDASTLQRPSADPFADARPGSKAGAYDKANTRIQELSRELAAEKQQLGALLAKADPSTLQAAATPRKASPPKRAIIYSTSNCPYCVQAKKYLFKKGVFYSEIDIDSSSAHAEFKRLGGTGVPLILIGDKRIQGFNQEAIDKALQ